ncbi:ATPase, F1 complex, gamma subunit domain-containing protein [Hyaloraphidium curvatum]|nr:ATPase, F1 complex, gamma subunit domain-containing protein [Hyaloraphidium curvatum]
MRRAAAGCWTRDSTGPFSPPRPSPLLMEAQARDMATLKEIQMRLKSISNIAKITKSMKMIASTKMSRAQRLMDVARTYGNTDAALFKYIEAKLPEEEGKTLYIVVSSDKGLCSGIHSSLSKFTRRTVAADSGIVVLGDKARTQLGRGATRAQMKMSFSAPAKASPTYYEACLIADMILKNSEGFDKFVVVYNRFKSVIAFETTPMPVFRGAAITEAPGLSQYEISEDEITENLGEFHFANALYWGIAEGQASELAARRTAMENATKNAGEMIDKLTLLYNRSRQASITNELVDIITGASAL